MASPDHYRATYAKLALGRAAAALGAEVEKPPELTEAEWAYCLGRDAGFRVGLQNAFLLGREAAARLIEEP